MTDIYIMLLVNSLIKIYVGLYGLSYYLIEVIIFYYLTDIVNFIIVISYHCLMQIIYNNI